ncbi:hypothetical protein V6N13_017654 [Hibiscus sabdariffa]
MGCCVSASSRSTCISRSHGEANAVSLTCFETGFCGTKKMNRTFSDHVIAVQNLPSVPNRVFANGKCRTSCILTQQGRKGVNQVAMIVWESRQNEYGGSCLTGNSKKTDGRDFEKERLNCSWREAFVKSYKAMDKELRSHPNLDCFCSGTTAVTLVKQALNLFMGYIGDSRAIMGSKDSNGSMVAIQLTVGRSQTVFPPLMGMLE